MHWRSVNKEDTEGEHLTAIPAPAKKPEGGNKEKIAERPSTWEDKGYQSVRQGGVTGWLSSAAVTI